MSNDWPNIGKQVMITFLYNNRLSEKQYDLLTTSFFASVAQNLKNELREPISLCNCEQQVQIKIFQISLKIVGGGWATLF